MKKPLLIAITGATASGKTAFAVKLAKELNTVVLNFDSRQFYREMQIGTAKPLEAELKGVPHYFLGNKSIQESFSAAHFASEALVLLWELFAKYSVVIAVGGSGLYLKALTEGLPPMPEIPQEIRKSIAEEYAQKGLAWLQKEVQSADDAFFQTVDVANHARLIRALEVIRASGKTFTHFRTQAKKESFFQVKEYFLQWPREELYERINQRVDLMMEAGLLQEVQHLLPYKHLNALHTVGYSELFEYFNGSLSLTQAVELIKQHTRNYAKRQNTWFLNKHPEITTLSAKEPLDDLIKQIISDINVV